MSGFFKFFKSLFAGVFGFFSGLFGKRSSSGYFLELEDAKGVASAPSISPSKAPEPTTAPKTDVNRNAQPVAKAEAAVTAPSKPDNKTKATTVTKELATVAQSADNPEPVEVATALNLPQPTITTFAPNYLNSANASPRRRPGANMSSFLNMARQVKPSS